MGPIQRVTSTMAIVGCLVGATACDSSDGSSSAPPSTAGASTATTTTVAPSAAAPTTIDTTTVAPTTVAPTTVAPTSVAPTATPSSTAPPTTSTAPDESVSGAVEGAIEAATIFGLHLFAKRPSDDVVTVVSDRLGAPTSDTGFVPTPDELACRGSDRFRVVRWGDLRMTFTEYPDETGAPTQSLDAWAVGDERAEQLAPNDEPPASVEPTGLTTIEGIGVGSSRADLQTAFADDQALNDFGEDRISVLAGSDPAGVLSFVLDGDTVVGIGTGPPDCAAPDDEAR